MPQNTPDRLRQLRAELQGIDPIRQPARFREVIFDYLKPAAGPAPRAHLFTVNGLTYPIHKSTCVAAVPDPHETVNGQVKVARSKRRYSMLAYMFGTRPGDLLFLFQADPQRPGSGVEDRRGFRGIWAVKSRPFRDVSLLSTPGYPYEILGSCPSCGTPFNFGDGSIVNGNKRCPICQANYGTVMLSGKVYSRVVLSLRAITEPLVVFTRAAGDNRVYSDMSVEPFIWISRADNAMGAGKGSSIRVLLPEEAAKVAYMLATEDSQTIDTSTCNPSRPAQQPVCDFNGVEVRFPRVRRARGTWQVEHEFHLNLYFSRNIDNPNSPIVRLLNIPLDRLEFWTNELPWGYTGDTCDFVAALWDDDLGRYKIYLFELKKDVIDKKALAQTLLYIPWVVQVLTQFRPETTNVEVQPVIVGLQTTLRALPQPYNLTLKFLTCSQPKNVRVITPILLLYKAVNVFQRNSINYASDIDFSVYPLPTRAFLGFPTTYTTTAVEQQHIVDTYLRGW